MRTIKKKAMSARILLPALLLASGLPAVTVSCSGTIHETAGDNVISFSSAVETKSPIESINDISQFAVWGYYDDGNGHYIDVFGQIGTENTSVEVRNETGIWVYDDVKMWQFGKTYNFHAVFPTDLKHVVEVPDAESSPFLSILDYDVKHSGMDVMVAESKGIIYPEGSRPSPVALAFKHLLTRIEFIGKIDDATAANLPGFKATIISARLYGLYQEGHFPEKHGEDDLADISWGFVSGTQTTSDNPFINISGIEMETSGTSLFGGEFFVFPSKSLTEYVLHIEWRAGLDGTMRTESQDIILSSASRTWDAGKKYTYTFNISDTDHILFDTPTVQEWDDAAGGIIIVD